MDRKLRKILTECIREIETGALDVEGCLQRYPDRAAELRPHLELWSGLNTASKAQPSFGSQQRGEHQLLGALADMEREGQLPANRFLTPVLVRAAAVVVGVALLAGGAAGASAALGGPNVPAEVLSGIGISNASDNGKEHANPNAFDGSYNAGQGIDNASETGREHANDNAFQGSSNAADREGNAADAAQDGLDTAEGAADSSSQGGESPESVPASDSAPDKANVPDSLPNIPKP